MLKCTNFIIVDQHVSIFFHNTIGYLFSEFSVPLISPLATMEVSCFRPTTTEIYVSDVLDDYNDNATNVTRFTCKDAQDIEFGAVLIITPFAV